MDTFRFLKYWKTNAVFAVNCGSKVRTANTITSTILTAASHHHPSSTDADGIESKGKAKHETVDCSNFLGNEDDDGESDETSASENERDEFFKFTEPIDLFLNAPEPDEKSRVSAIKTAAMFRVLMLRLKKSKASGAEKTEPDGSVSTTANQTQRKLLGVEELSNSEKQQISAESGSSETRSSTDLVQKYLERVKPMYVRVSKRYNEKKLRLKSSGSRRSGQSQPSKSNSMKSMAEKRGSGRREMRESPLPVTLKTWKQGNLPARMRVLSKDLGKRKSASSGLTLTREKRRDDSLLEKEDGIRSAILHCKRSFNGCKDSVSGSLSDGEALNHREIAQRNSERLAMEA